jgi:hypothetical protein
LSIHLLNPTSKQINLMGRYPHEWFHHHENERGIRDDPLAQDFLRHLHGDVDSRLLVSLLIIVVSFRPMHS